MDASAPMHPAQMRPGIQSPASEASFAAGARWGHKGAGCFEWLLRVVLSTA